MMTDKNDAAIGTRLPFLFIFRDTLFGNGFVVEVVAKNGRALCVRELDGFWMYGVNPGGMAASGEDADAAQLAFRRMFSAILKDLALEAESFEAYERVVRAFVDDTNIGHERDWVAAVDTVRHENIHIAGIQRAPADSRRDVRVTIKHDEQISASDNRADLSPALAA